MKTINYASIAVTLTVTGLAVSPSVWAVPIVGACASTLLSGCPPPVYTNTSLTSASESVVNLDSRNEGYVGQGAADSAGNLGVSAAFLGAGGGAITVGASALWTDTFNFVSGPATFDFFIPGAAIGFESNNVPGLSGSFLVDILLNGSSIFSAGAALAMNPNSPNGASPSVATDLLLTQTGTPLTSTFATNIAPSFGTPIGVGSAGYRFGPYSGSLALSPLVGMNTIEYSMQAMVSGSRGETSAIASIGDPLSLSQQPFGATLTVAHAHAVSVPEPTTLSLLGAGLLAIGFGRRRRVSA